MTDDIPISEKSTEDAKSVKPTRAEKKATDKVREHVESGKPRPRSADVDSAPDFDPEIER